MFLEIFNELLDENDLNRKQFSEKSGIPYTTVIGWTKLNRLPDYTALLKIAEFFNCSIDYLTGRQDAFESAVTPTEMSVKEQSLLKNFRALDAESKELILNLTKKIKKTNAKTRKK